MLNSENSSQFVVNNKSRQQAMNVAGKYFIQAHLVSIRLQAPTVEGYGRKDAVNLTSGMATKESKNIPYMQLPKNAMLAFDVTLIAPIVYTSHEHELMALQNGRAHSYEETFTVYANASTIEFKLLSDYFASEKLADSLHSLIKLFWKESQSERTSEKWQGNAKKGYQKYAGKNEKNKAIWVNFSSPKAKPAITAESENLAPIVDTIPASYITDVNMAWNQALKEYEKRQKANTQNSVMTSTEIEALDVLKAQ